MIFSFLSKTHFHRTSEHREPSSEEQKHVVDVTCGNEEHAFTHQKLNQFDFPNQIFASDNVKRIDRHAFSQINTTLVVVVVVG